MPSFPTRTRWGAQGDLAAAIGRRAPPVDVAARSYLATGRQPIEAGRRAAFPDWLPAGEQGEDAQPLPVWRHGETAPLTDAAVEEKRTRPPSRYNEGTLVAAMQNAWRFVADGPWRDRLREAKGIGTPATRAEVIHGLKAQEFLTLDGKHLVPTERGLALFGVPERADPALVDPGVAAQLKLLLDEVLIGSQELAGARRCCMRAGAAHHRPAYRRGMDVQALPPMSGVTPLLGKTARGGTAGKELLPPAADPGDETPRGQPGPAERHRASRRLRQVRCRVPLLPGPACARQGQGRKRRRPGSGNMARG